MAVTDFDPETRLQVLNQELAKAREIIADLDARKLATQQQVLRIEGAVALIGEILAAKPVAASTPVHTSGCELNNMGLHCDCGATPGQDYFSQPDR